MKNFRSGITFFLGAIVLFSVLPGCGQKKKEAAPAPKAAAAVAAAAQPAQGQKMSFEELLAKAHVDEAYFTGLCRLLNTRQLLLAIENPAAAENGKKPTQFQIKILPPNEVSKKGTALIFSGSQALAAAGQKLNWKKNEQGMYSYAALTGQALFRALQNNGYDAAVLDIVSPNAFAFGPEAVKAFAAGNIPAFKAPASAPVKRPAVAQEPVRKPAVQEAPVKAAAAAAPVEKADAH